MLFWYDRNYRAVSQSAVTQPRLSAVKGSCLRNRPANGHSVKISSVVGAGTVTSEIVVVKFEGEST
ncbi:hypothetical protein [Candidatus Villigracilis affinis]|uniref:hypothetical protein n=1 Tax=Candidatus Villigracilis affinis TaxID=3140682 RepID=UPI002A1B94A2|nr:hypothetical protein [Anaerolineales bacterium]